MFALLVSLGKQVFAEHKEGRGGVVEKEKWADSETSESSFEF